MRPTPTSLWLAAALCAAVPIRGAAHEGPEHEIEELTERMKIHGESADLLTERAVEFRVLGKLPEATKDLERAAVLDPGSVVIHRELGRVLFLGGKDGDAIAAVTRGLGLKSGEPAEIASLRMLRAEILRSQRDHRKALDDCDTALALYSQNPEWYLLRSDIHRRLGAHEERLAGLEIGIRETGAGVLEIERVEALLDAGRFDPALRFIEPELEASRIRSSWLIRRGRALIGLDRRPEAGQCLREALEEIGNRLNPKMPDLPLLLDKALAHELLGETKEALRAYREARDKGATDAADERIKALEATGTPPSQPAPAGKPPGGT